jgi:hypothetical protein
MKYLEISVERGGGYIFVWVDFWTRKWFESSIFLWKWLLTGGLLI